MKGKILIGFVVVLCAVALFLGNRANAPKETTKEKVEQKHKEPVQTENDTYHSVNEDDKDIDTTSVPSQTMHFTKEQLNKSKSVAILFVKQYHNFDAYFPAKHIEDSKRYMSDELYKIEMANVSRGTLDAVKKKWTDITVTEVANSSTTKIFWNVIAQSENTDSDGKTVIGEDWYLVQLENMNGEYKVTGVRVNDSE